MTAAPLPRLVAHCRELGVGNAALLAINRLLRRLHPHLGVARYYLMAQPVVDRPWLPRRGHGLEIRILRPGDPALATLPRPAPRLERQPRGEAVCFGAFRPGAAQPLGHLWLLPGRHREEEHRCLLRAPPSPRCILDVDVYVAPEARGGFVFAHLWDTANAWLREHGVQWTLSRISAFNPGSLRAHQRLGARRVGSLFFVQAGTLEILLTGRRPFVAISRSRSKAPEITIHPPRHRCSV